jgi:hypothetical protein
MIKMTVVKTDKEMERVKRNAGRPPLKVAYRGSKTAVV